MTITSPYLTQASQVKRKKKLSLMQDLLNYFDL